MPELVGRTANQQPVYYVTNSYLPLHLAEEPRLVEYVAEALPRVYAEGDNAYTDVDLG